MDQADAEGEWALAAADRMLSLAERLREEPEFAWAFDAAGGQSGGGDDWRAEDAATEDDVPWTLADLIEVPAATAAGTPLDDDYRRRIALDTVRLSDQTSGDPFRVVDVPESWQVSDPERGGTHVQGIELPAWAARAIVADFLLGPSKLRLVPVTKERAAEFVRAHHSKLPTLNPRGFLFAFGVVRGARLVGVATANTPTGRWADPHSVVELTRVASDGTVKGAASKLTAKIIKVVQRMKPRKGAAPMRFVTYQLDEEAGTTYKALRDLGLRPTAYLRGRKAPSGARAGVEGDPALARVAKIRWEAGPGAAPADWSLLDKRVDAPPAISSARSPSMNVADRVYNVVLAATSGDLRAFVLRNEAAVRAAIQVAIADAQSRKKAPPARRGVRTVEDAGAYLPGARKHMWTPGERVTALDLDDIEAAPAGTRKKYLTKQYVLGKFDWEAEQAAGVTPEAAVLKEKIWSSVAGFPEDTPTARKMYVLGADWLRAQLIGLANREDVVDFLTTWKATLSNTILGRAIPGAEIARMFGYDPENLPQRDASLRRDYTDIDVFTPEMRSENYAQRRQLEKDIKEHIAEQLDADELDYMRAQLRHLEAVGRLAITSVELARHGYKTIVHSAYQNQYMLGTGASYRAHLEAGPAQYLVALAGFDMREFTSHSMEPRSSAGQKQQLLKLVRRGYFGYTEEVRRSADRATWEKLLGPRAAPTRNKTWVRATENIKRVGPPTGRPANLSENDLLREFGFRGDQFGKSISDADRLKHRELAWDAFADLARILGIRRQEIGGCGLLGFAFGARGSGRAAAHYESINKITHEYFPVINLTNTQGDGAVAHEWGHFFDHHASESPQRIVPSGNSVEVQFASGGRGGTPHPHAKIAEKMAALSVAMRRALPGDAERVREEATAIYLAVDARLSELNTLIRAKAISRDEYETEWKKAKARLANRQDAKHSYFYRSAQLMGEYWERPTEMFARAFEAWIEDELHARGEVNTYLVHGTRRAYDFDITKSGDDFVVEPYPLGKERERINAAMRDLMTTVAQSDLLCRGR